MKTRKIIVSLFALSLVIVFASGCATTVKNEETIPIPITEPTSEIETEEPTVSNSTTQAAIENLFIQKLGEENVDFLLSDDGTSYCIVYYVDFSYDTFWSDGTTEYREELMNLLDESSAIAHNGLSYTNVHVVLYSRIDGVVYVSTNGADNTLAWVIAEANN